MAIVNKNYAIRLDYFCRWSSTTEYEMYKTGCIRLRCNLLVSGGELNLTHSLTLRKKHKSILHVYETFYVPAFCQAKNT